MTHVVCEPCTDCKYTDCVAVCPVDCFYQDEMMLVIHPKICTDCEACVPECPVEAIYRDSDVPSQWQSFEQLNADRSVALEQAGANISKKQTPREGPGCKGKS